MDSLDKTERSHILTLSDEPEPKDAFLFATPDLLRPLLAVTTTTPPEGDTAETPVWQSNDRFVNAYYEEFHDAHPFLLSRTEHAEYRSIVPAHLEASMAFVGAHYRDAGRSSHLTLSGVDLLAPAPDDVFKVQSYILRSIACLGRMERTEAAQNLRGAVQVATRLCMNREIVVQSYPVILQECFRRTWWEMFLVAGLCALLHNIDVGFSLDECDVMLPEDGLPSQPSFTGQGGLEDMKDRFFSEIDRDWSATAFKVEAIRILGNISKGQMPSLITEGPKLDAHQATISGWWLSLPCDKREYVGGSSAKDESIFFAQMAMSVASIGVNLPQSDLTYTWTARTTFNLPSKASCQGARHHTVLALRAANHLSRLIAFGNLSRLHTPCTVNMVAFAIIVQVAAYAGEHDSSDASHIRENIQLGLGYLKRMSDVWPLAVHVRVELAALARDVLKTPSLHVSIPASEQTENKYLQPWLIDARAALVGPKTRLTAEPTIGVCPPQEMQFNDEDDSWLDQLLNTPPHQ